MDDSGNLVGVSITGTEAEAGIIPERAIVCRLVQAVSRRTPATIYNTVSLEPGCMSAANYLQLPAAG